MPGSGNSTGRSRGEDRFYCPPARRRQQQEKEKLQQEREKEKEKEREREKEKDQSRVYKPSGTKKIADLGIESEKRTITDCDTSASNCSASASNLDRFLEYTTPTVLAQDLPKTSLGARRVSEADNQPFFVLEDLWESFREWSAYGAGVPLLLNGSDSVIQYYVPYLSGIQLYIDPNKPLTRRRRPGEESDTESSKDTSSEGSFEGGRIRGFGSTNGRPWSQTRTDVWVEQSINGLSLKDKSCSDSSCDEAEMGNQTGQLIFEYLERDPPYSREPLADKISLLASRFPELRTCWSCDLSPSSWISVAWYPIYRIPTGPTLQNLDACFLTFHSLSTLHRSKFNGLLDSHGLRAWEVYGREAASLKLSLPLLGLASYKFKVSVWNSGGVTKANLLFRDADNWLRHLQVNHPDFTFFVSHSSYQR